MNLDNNTYKGVGFRLLAYTILFFVGLQIGVDVLVLFALASFLTGVLK